MNQKLKAIFEVILILLLFLISSYIVRQNIDFLRNLIGMNFYGVFVYILITTIAIVIAPISMMPLIPLASNLWGWQYAAIINVIGWTLGSIIVFFICRKYGVPLIKKFVSLERINKIEAKIPEEGLFFSAVLLRMIIPVDVLSYALSLFTKINFKTYVAATVIGIIPFAFVFSYLGTVPWYYQIAGFFMVGLIVALIFEFYKKRHS